MDCRNVEMCPTKSRERISRALRVFPEALLMRVLAFALHLLGAKRAAIGALVGMPEESVKTATRLALRDGFSALRDRRRSEAPAVAPAPPPSPRITARREEEWYVVEWGNRDTRLKIPVTFRVQARTVLLSLVNAGLLSVQEAAATLGMHAAHCRELSRKLAGYDVEQSLIDKRQGQKQDYRVGPTQKSELIQQLAARAITGQSTSSAVLAAVVRERTQVRISARTVRWHVHKLGLTRIHQTLPQLVEALKKTS